MSPSMPTAWFGYPKFGWSSLDLILVQNQGISGKATDTDIAPIRHGSRFRALVEGE